MSSLNAPFGARCFLTSIGILATQALDVLS